MDQFSHLKPFSKIAGKLSKYFGKAPIRRRPSIDIEDQSESNDESTETDFFSQEDSQPQFEYYRTHQDFINHCSGAASDMMPNRLPPSPRKRSVTWEMAPVAMVPSPAAGAENAVDFQNSRFVCAKADWHAVEAGDLELKKDEYYEAAHCFEDGWWLGRNSDGVVGVFPSNFVEVIETSWF